MEPLVTVNFTPRQLNAIMTAIVWAKHDPVVSQEGFDVLDSVEEIIYKIPEYHSIDFDIKEAKEV